ncbi:MAG: response regulator [Synechococcales cyanobacterium T60_A2020_003]|nr:response regulator [Synechococcales cyanobacterium T60_A2020_003]
MASHKILVIDDSRVIRNMVRDMLPKGNFEVLEAKDGIEGLDTIRQEKPNLIMLDFLLPRMSGWEVFQQIQASNELQRIPLVIMSGRREEVTEKLSEPFEFFEFIEKPFEQKELIEAIKSAMAKARLPRPNLAGSASSADIAGDDEIAQLKHQVATLQTEINTLKRQMAQLLTYIKQKLR